MRLRCARTPTSPGGWRGSFGVAPSPPTRELASQLRREGSARLRGRGPLPFPQRLEVVRGGAFAGRQAAIARLHEALARARGGERCVALVTGEPGIGKTRLLAEFAHAGPRTTTRSCCTGAARKSRPSHTSPSSRRSSHSRARTRPWSVSCRARGGRPGAPAADPEGDRARMFDAVAESLERIARAAASRAGARRSPLGRPGDAAAAAPPGDAPAAQSPAPARQRARHRAGPRRTR